MSGLLLLVAEYCTNQVDVVREEGGEREREAEMPCTNCVYYSLTQTMTMEPLRDRSLHIPPSKQIADHQLHPRRTRRSTGVMNLPTRGSSAKHGQLRNERNVSHVSSYRFAEVANYLGTLALASRVIAIGRLLAITGRATRVVESVVTL